MEEKLLGDTCAGVDYCYVERSVAIIVGDGWIGSKRE
jgi:hypothetical protein